MQQNSADRSVGLGQADRMTGKNATVADAPGRETGPDAGPKAGPNAVSETGFDVGADFDATRRAAAQISPNRSDEQIVSPWGSRADRAAERAAKRQAVLSTAVRFFNSKGFHATALEDVARALNVTKPTIYHYFSSKDDILFECVRLGLAGLREAAETTRAQGGSGRDRLTALMGAYGTIMTRDFGKCVTLTSDDLLSQDSRVKFRALKRDIHEMLQSVIEEGMRDGTVAQGDPRILAFTIAGALNWIARWYDPAGDQPADVIVDGTLRALLAGIEPR